MNRKIFDVFVLLIILLFSVLISFFAKPPLLVSIALFYFLPSAWLSYRSPKHIKRVALFSLFTTLLFFVADYIAVLDQAWFVSTIFPFRFLNLLPVEDSIWAFFGTYLFVYCYEYFYDNIKHKVYDKKLKRFAIGITLSTLALAFCIFYYPSILRIPFAYLWIGLVLGILPVVFVVLRHRNIAQKMLAINLYSLLIHFPFEISALKSGQWGFFGKNFIGWINIFGVRFPVEEFVLYIMMTGIVILSYYHLFDHKD